VSRQAQDELLQRYGFKGRTLSRLPFQTWKGTLSLYFREKQAGGEVLAAPSQLGTLAEGQRKKVCSTKGEVGWYFGTAPRGEA
jgi:hypothetical protein